MQHLLKPKPLHDTLPHTETQPGLRGHSINEDDNLLKKWVVKKRVNHDSKQGGYWVAIKSFDTMFEGFLWLNANHPRRAALNTITMELNY